MDFISDQPFDGRPFRILTIVDMHTREALSAAPRASLRAAQVVEVLDQLVRVRGKPKSLRVDNVLYREAAAWLGQQVSIASLH